MNARFFGYCIAWVMLISALFLPKINLIGLGGATFIRLDDFLVALFFGFYFLGGHLLDIYEHPLKKWMLAFLLFVMISMASVFLNAFVYHRIDIFSGFLFSFRHLEYFIYVYAGIEFSRRGVNMLRIFTWLVWYLVMLVVLQQLGVLGSFGGFSTERASANTAGPFELAVIVSFLLFYFLTEQNIGWLRFFNLFAAIGLLLLTQSRITIFGVFCILFAWYFFYVKIYRFTKFYVLISVTIFISVVYFSTRSEFFGLTERFFQTLDMDFLGLFALITDLPPIKSSDDYFRLAYDDLLVGIDDFQGDSSALVRFYRWSLLISMTFSNFNSIVLGVGPSFASVAVDGYYVRLLVETGFLGLFAYLMLIFWIYRLSARSKSMRHYVVVLIFTALFIDIFTSSKAMFIFWFWFGYAVLNPGKNFLFKSFSDQKYLILGVAENDSVKKLLNNSSLDIQGRLS